MSEFIKEWKRSDSQPKVDGFASGIKQLSKNGDESIYEKAPKKKMEDTNWFGLYHVFEEGDMSVELESAKKGRLTSRFGGLSGNSSAKKAAENFFMDIKPVHKEQTPERINFDKKDAGKRLTKNFENYLQDQTPVNVTTEIEDWTRDIQKTEALLKQCGQLCITTGLPSEADKDTTPIITRSNSSETKTYTKLPAVPIIPITHSHNVFREGFPPIPEDIENPTSSSRLKKLPKDLLDTFNDASSIQRIRAIRRIVGEQINPKSDVPDNAFKKEITNLNRKVDRLCTYIEINENERSSIAMTEPRHRRFKSSCHSKDASVINNNQTLTQRTPPPKKKSKKIRSKSKGRSKKVSKTSNHSSSHQNSAQHSFFHKKHSSIISKLPSPSKVQYTSKKSSRDSSPISCSRTSHVDTGRTMYKEVCLRKVLIPTFVPPTILPKPRQVDPIPSLQAPKRLQPSPFVAAPNSSSKDVINRISKQLSNHLFSNDRLYHTAN